MSLRCPCPLAPIGSRSQEMVTGTKRPRTETSGDPALPWSAALFESLPRFSQCHQMLVQPSGAWQTFSEQFSSRAKPDETRSRSKGQAIGKIDTGTRLNDIKHRVACCRPWAGASRSHEVSQRDCRREAEDYIPAHNRCVGQQQDEGHALHEKPEI